MESGNCEERRRGRSGKEEKRKTAYRIVYATFELIRRSNIIDPDLEAV